LNRYSDGMASIEEPLTGERAEVWLTPDQLASWLSVVRLVTRLPVTHVRQLVIDNLSPQRLRRLGEDADRIVQRIDSPAR
jgi:hypothetical protein